jgi:SRSO17 transposase
VQGMARGRIGEARAAPTVPDGSYGDLVEDRAEETLLIEWPEGEAEPTKCWLSNLAERTSFRKLVDIAKMFWRIERDDRGLR